ncbi:MAG: exodeoxyribonuclease VII small subunit [Bacteroidota bacterium]
MSQEKFSLEDKLTEIRKLIDQMQKGVSDFDQQVALYQAGSAMIKECREYLDASELQIKQLIDGEEKSVGE